MLDMKSIIFGVAVAFAIFTISSSADASKMNGKGYGCSDRMCKGINSPNFGKQKGKSGH
jgi:hypothetical protein